MKFAPKSAAALAPFLFALAACGGGADEAARPAAEARPPAAEPRRPREPPTTCPDAGRPTPARRRAGSDAHPAPPRRRRRPPPRRAPSRRCSPVRRLPQHRAAARTASGPSLAGVFGRQAGTSPGFDYSEAMKDPA